MKKRIFTLVAAVMCMVCLSSCGQNIAKEAAEKGRGYFDSGDYETAAKAFGLAVDNGTEDEEIKLLYDITLGYYQANKAYEERDLQKADKILSEIKEDYIHYGISEKIIALKGDIAKAMEIENLLNYTKTCLNVADYSGAEATVAKIDPNSLSPEQTELLNGYKTNIAAARAEQERVANERRAAEEARKKAAAEKAKKEKEQNTVKVQTPAININVGSGEYIYPTDTKLLTVDILKTLKKSDIALIRNEIYARRGHIFGTAKYANYFSQKSWYKPEKDVRWADLNDIERQNIKIIAEYEGNL